MSIADVKNFYEYLEQNPEVQQEALSLQDRYPEQEHLIDAFLQLAEREGFHFDLTEFMEVMYQNARE